MPKLNIIWDFDGTLLPLAPWDSEQFLMLYQLARIRPHISRVKGFLVKVAVHADRVQLLGKWFKTIFVRFMQGTPIGIFDGVCRQLAAGIPGTDRQALRGLYEEGHAMTVLSCGTADLSERILKTAGIHDCFDDIVGNRFRFEDGHIAGMDFHVPDAKSKVRYVISKNLKPEETVAIGDGYTDFPLLDWAGLSILIERNRKKTDKKREAYHHAASIAEAAAMVKLYA